MTATATDATAAGEEPIASEKIFAKEQLALQLAEIAQLADETDRELAIKDLAKTSKVPVRVLRKRVKALRKKFGLVDEEDGKGELQGDALAFDDPEPYPEPVVVADMIENLYLMVKRFVVLGPDDALAVALWIVSTYMVEDLRVAPILNVRSPEKRCGKTALLEFCQKVVRRPLVAASATPAALFRAIALHRPTVLLDEVDQASLYDNPDLRALMNAGYKRSAAFVLRTVGDNHEVRSFDVFSFRLLAGIGDLPATIADRAVIVNLRRKRPEERVHRLSDTPEATFLLIRRMLARLAADYGRRVADAMPSMPDALHDRAREIWSPLLAIADLAGAGFGEEAREAAVHLLKADEVDTESAGVKLLRDIKAVFTMQCADKLHTTTLVEALVAMPDVDYGRAARGKEITANWLATRLRPYSIWPDDVRIGQVVKKGYNLLGFADAFERYLGGDPVVASEDSSTPNPSATAATPLHASNGAGSEVSRSENESATAATRPHAEVGNVAFASATPSEVLHPATPSQRPVVAPVAPVAPEMEEEEITSAGDLNEIECSAEAYRRAARGA